jgi:hypothetical protein
MPTRTGTKIGEDTIGGQAVDIYATGTGRFIIYKHGSDDTVLANDAVLDVARKTASAKLSRARVKLSIPFYTLTGEKGIATGIHAGTERILIRVNGKSEQAGYHYRALRGDMTDEDRNRLVEISRITQELAQKQRALIEKNRFDLTEAVRSEIDKGNVGG